MKYVLLFVLVGCGNTVNIPKRVELKPTKPVEVEPVKVDIPNTTQTVIHTIDITASSTMFRTECEEEFATEQEIELCMNDKLTEFLQNIVNIQNGLNNEQPL